MQVELSDREVATLLAALRNWQIDGLNEDLADAFAGHFEDHDPLSDDEIDELCERLNFGEEAEGQVITTAAV
jgi:predicted transcriptional regulator